MKIGFTELLLVAVLVFLLFGPEALVRIARQIGLFMNRLGKEIDDLNENLSTEEGRGQPAALPLETEKNKKMESQKK